MWPFLTRPVQFLVVLVIFTTYSQGQSRDVRAEVIAIQDAIQADDLNTAWRLVDAALKQRPGDGGLYNLRGVVHARRNELQDAHKDFVEAVRLQPALTPGWQNLARVCQLQADSDRSTVSCAVDAWQRVLRLRDDAEAHSSLAMLYERQEKFAQSLLQTDLLAAAEASRTANLIVRCVDLRALGRVNEAQAAASQLAQRADFLDSDLHMMRGALESPKAADIAATLMEGLDAQHEASLATLGWLSITYEE
jgi:tetratricopeptide (TPR) repeat protein